MKNNLIETAIIQLQNGNIVALPTETVYGLAADSINTSAIQKIFELKGRPESVAISLLIPKDAPLERFAIDIPELAHQLAKQYWPGPLTIILKKKPHISDILTGGKQTIGLRCPNHPITLEILKHFPQGLAAPSANPYGQPPPISAEEVRGYFNDQIMIINGGPCKIGLASTVVDLSDGMPVVLRQGIITLSPIAKS
jgi:L-threonylcarbamoyladenylate synthase